MSIVIIVLFSITLMCFLIWEKDVFSPIVLHSISWLLVLISGLFFSQIFFKIATSVYYILLIWYYSFTAGYCLIRFTNITSLFDYNQIDSKHKNIVPIEYNYTWLLLLLLILAIYKLYLIGFGMGGDFFSNLKKAGFSKDSDAEQMGFLLRFLPVFLVLFIRESLTLNKHNYFRFLLLSIWQVIMVVGTGSKLTMLLPLLGIIITRNFLSKIKLSKLLMVFAIIILIMVAFQLARAGKNENYTIIDYLGIYIYSPLVAFSEFANSLNNHTDLFGVTSLSFIYKILAPLIGATPEYATLGGWYFVPLPTNVFTIMFPSFSDFGVAGVLFFSFLNGTVYGLLYKKALNGDSRFCMLYGLFATCIIMEMFGDVLGGFLSLYIQIIFWVFILDWISREPKSKIKGLL